MACGCVWGLGWGRTDPGRIARIDAVSEKDNHDSGGSSYEAEGGRTPEGSDSLFVEDEDEDISVDDEEPPTSFRSPKALVGMEVSEHEEKLPELVTGKENEEKTTVKEEQEEEVVQKVQEDNE